LLAGAWLTWSLAGASGETHGHAITNLITGEEGAHLVEVGVIDIDGGLEVESPNVGPSSTRQFPRWQRVRFAQPFATPPVVILSPPTYADRDPVIAVTRNIDCFGFEVAVNEWEYLDGIHKTESLSFLAIEAGIYNFGGLRLIAFTEGGESRSLDGLRTMRTLDFDGFDSVPVVLPQAYRLPGSDDHPGASSAAHARLSEPPSESAASLVLQFQEAIEATAVVAESRSRWAFHALVIEEGPGNLYGRSFKVDRPLREIDHRWNTVRLGPEFAEAAFFASPQTFTDPDTAAIRIRPTSRKGDLRLRLQEEQSHDRETTHQRESIAHLAFPTSEVIDDVSAAGIIHGQIVSSSPGDELSVPFPQTYRQPIVVVGIPLSSHSEGAFSVRLVEVGPAGFTVRLDREAAKTGYISPQVLNWIAMETGVYRIGQQLWRAGEITVPTTGEKIEIPFETPFRRLPAIFANLVGQFDTGSNRLAIRDQQPSLFAAELVGSPRDGSTQEKVHFIGVDTGFTNFPDKSRIKVGAKISTSTGQRMRRPYATLFSPSSQSTTESGSRATDSTGLMEFLPSRTQASLHPDSDRDGISDIDESLHGTDPGKRDTDNDGLSDFAEINGPTNPLLSDSDGGGFNDGWEVANGFDPLDSIDDRQPLVPGLLAHIPFTRSERIAGIEAGLKDTSPYLQHPAIINDPIGAEAALVEDSTFETGRGTVLWLDASSDYLALPASSHLLELAGGSYSACLWFRAQQMPPAYRQSLLQVQGGFAQLRLNSQARFESVLTEAYGRSNRKVMRRLSAPKKLAARPGDWHHVVATIDRDTRRHVLYLDGREIGSRRLQPLKAQALSLLIRAGADTGTGSGAGSWLIGILDPSASTPKLRQAMDGYLDDIRLYSRALSADHVRALYHQESSGSPIDTIDDDQDGLPDNWEIEQFGDTESYTGTDDPDGDGLDNAAEYRGQTNATDYFNGVTHSLAIISGSEPTAAQGSASPEAIVFKVRHADGTPAVSAPVIVSVTASDGGLSWGLLSASADGSSPVRQLRLRSDSGGLVRAYYVGGSSGSGARDIITAWTDVGSLLPGSAGSDHSRSVATEAAEAQALVPEGSSEVGLVCYTRNAWLHYDVFFGGLSWEVTRWAGWTDAPYALDPGYPSDDPVPPLYYDPIIGYLDYTDPYASEPDPFGYDDFPDNPPPGSDSLGNVGPVSAAEIITSDSFPNSPPETLEFPGTSITEVSASASFTADYRPDSWGDDYGNLIAWLQHEAIQVKQKRVWLMRREPGNQAVTRTFLRVNSSQLAPGDESVDQYKIETLTIPPGQRFSSTFIDLEPNLRHNTEHAPDGIDEWSDALYSRVMEEHEEVLLPVEIVPDYNRDGRIDNQDRGRVSKENPWRWWVNDDNDQREPRGRNEDDIPKGGIPDTHAANHVVDGVRDLLDFFPLKLDIASVLEAFPPEQHTYRLTHDEEAFGFIAVENIVPVGDPEVDGPGSFLRNIARANHLSDSDVRLVDADGTAIQIHFLRSVRDQGTGVLLLEARKETTSPLKLTIEDLDGKEVATIEFPVSISGVEKMYRHVNLRKLTGGDGGNEKKTGERPAYPDALTNGRYLAYIHGFSVSGESARGSQSNLFKRFHQLGSRARFVGISWFGDPPNPGLNLGLPPDYHRAVYNGLTTGMQLRDALSFVGKSELTIVAHSLGNSVAGNAIAHHGLEVANYFIVNGAIALETYDPGQTGNSSGHPDMAKYMTEDDWKPYYDYDDGSQRRLLSCNWHELFDPETDARGRLTWRGFFATPELLSVAHNFYSPGDEVVENPDETEELGQLANLWSIYNERHAWVAQEIAKGGQNTITLAGFHDLNGGWEFNSAYDKLGPGLLLPGSNYTRRCEPAEAKAAITDEMLRIKPFHRRFLYEDLYDPAKGPGTAADTDKLYRLLGAGIPASSYAIAANPLESLGEFGNHNMQSEYKNPHAEWPVHPNVPDDQPQNWAHSDFKDVAIPYIYPLYQKMIEVGNLDGNQAEP
jgi:hypothetical protein